MKRQADFFNGMKTTINVKMALVKGVWNIFSFPMIPIKV
jgi:hypothetical protein